MTGLGAKHSRHSPPGYYPTRTGHCLEWFPVNPTRPLPGEHSLELNDLGFRSALLRAVREQGYTIPAPVHARSILAILSGRDVMAVAPTASGKTAASKETLR